MKKKRDYKLIAYLFAAFVAGAGCGMYGFMLANPIRIMCLSMQMPGAFQ